MLGIASRKAGSDIECPKCGLSQGVPTEEAALAALTMGQFAQTPPGTDMASDVVVYDDQPAAIETSGPHPDGPRPEKGPDTPSSGPALPSEPSGASGRSVPRGMILFPRRVFYVQGLLFVIVALGAFGAGYFIGRGDATDRLRTERKQASQEQTQIPGKLVYDRGGGDFVGDEGAVIIVLPDGGVTTRIPFEHIRPQDPVLDAPPKSVRLIREQGGEMARARPSGQFDLVVPDRGDYCLLIISRGTRRSGNAAVDEVDLSEMQEYFSSPENLIGDRKYRWLSKEVNAGLSPVEIDFGRDGQD